MASRSVGALSGVLFALFAFLSLSVIDPLRQAEDDALVTWWTDTGNVATSVTSMELRLWAIPFLLVFLASVRLRFDKADRGTPWPQLWSSSGVLAGAGLAVSALSRGITAQAAANGEPIPGPDTLRFATELAYQSYGVVAIGALGLMALGGGLSAIHAKALPAGLGWLGVAVGVISLLMVGLQMGPLASPLLLLWVLVVSISITWRPEQSETPAVDGYATV